MFFFRARAAGACVLIAGFALTNAHGQSLDSAAPLTLGQAIERALAANPALQGFAFALRAEDARIALAGQRPGTQASFELENVLGSGNFNGLNAVEATFALSHVIELGDKRQLRGDAARSSRDFVSSERQAAQLDVLAEVTRRFIAVAAAGEQLALTEEATTLAKGTLDDVTRKVRAAKSPEGELLRARAAFSRSGLEEQRAIAQLSAARQGLAAQWGGTRADFSGVSANLYAFPELFAFEDLVARLDGNPDFLRFTSEARLRDAELRLARSMRKPDLAISGGVRRLEETSDQALVMGVSVPLFAGRRAVPLIAEAEALRGQVDAERTTAMILARTRLYSFYEELRQAIRETETLQREVMPLLEEARKATAYAYARGRYGYLELVDAQRALLDARRAAIDSAVDAQALLAEIERLTGEPLVDESAKSLLSDGGKP